MTHAFECSMGDKHVVQAVIFEGRLAELPVHYKRCSSWYIDDIPILIFETKNKRKKKIKQKKKRRKKKRLKYRVPDH